MKQNQFPQGLSGSSNVGITGAMLGAFLLTLVAGATLTGCESDSPGYSKTTRKEVIDTPTAKTTVNETKTKDTTITPR